MEVKLYKYFTSLLPNGENYYLQKIVFETVHSQRKWIKN